MLYHKKANGKLLLTSEYYILEGAEGIALPTKLGQSLTVSHNDQFKWTALNYQNNKWIDGLQPSEELKFLNYILEEISKLKKINTKFKFETKLEFPNDWGLGSSSTLIALLSDYFQVNPYILNQIVFKGSGYDIACAFHSNPIVYSNLEKLNPRITEITISENIKKSMYFIYLDKKQNSREGISHFKSLTNNKTTTILRLNEITKLLSRSQDLKEWIKLLEEHENLISKNLNIEKVSKTSLKDLPFFSKSLGAWGGDFALIISEKEDIEVKEICKKKNFNTVFSYNELILS